MTFAPQLAAFARQLRFEDLPPEVVTSVRLRPLDILGIALAASTTELAPALYGALEGWASGGQGSSMRW